MHAPGIVLRPKDTPEAINRRLFEEICSDHAVVDLIELPHVIREDQVRNVTCLSIVYLLKISESDLMTLNGHWKIYSHESILHDKDSFITDQVPLFLRAIEHIEIGATRQ